MSHDRLASPANPNPSFLRRLHGVDDLSGVVMESEAAKERKREHHRKERQQLKSLVSPLVAFVKCPTCGGRVKLPCRLCEVRGVK